jgi:UDP-N-acetylglucosamine--N-acetylmuramyl-(pentapeptide) pyrophosphoryl-undecaprenol N-acetylglucosamine transferase
MSVEALWIGTRGGLEARIVPAAGVAFRALPAAPVAGAGWRLPLHLVQLARGTIAAWRLMRALRPDVLLVTGGYVSVPSALAARAVGVPVAIFLPDVRPGRAVAALARVAGRIFTTSADTLAWLPAGKGEATGYPVRAQVRAADRTAARRRLGLANDRPLVLIFGGSRGARRINRAAAAAAAELLERADLLHITGSLDFGQVAAQRATLASDVARGYRVHEFLEGAEMAEALAAADLVVSRAGAAVLGEYAARGLPSLLVPLPLAGGHQDHNARVLANAGAAVIVRDQDLSGERLAAEVRALLDAPPRLAAMGAAALGLDHPDAPARIARGLLALVRHAPRGVAA